MLNIRATTSATQPAPVHDTPGPTAAASPRTADTGIGSRPNATPATADTLPARRTALPVNARTPALTSALRNTDIAGRLQDMKSYLADLQGAQAPRRARSQAQSRDAQFLDLLAAVENDRDPSLRLSAQTIDHAAFGKGPAAERKAMAGLARTAIDGMNHGTWHAVVSIRDHEVALAAKHDPQHPARLSLVVVDSKPRDESDPLPWANITQRLQERMNQDLAKAGKPAEAQVWLYSVNTKTQGSYEGGAIFALAAVRDLPRDAGVKEMHDATLKRQAEYPKHPAAAYDGDRNNSFGARLFKHMAYTSEMEKLLVDRPDLKDVPVNKKGQTLLTHQADHMFEHKALFGVPFRCSDSYEQKRLRLYERLESALVPHLAAQQLPGMKEYLNDVLHAVENGTPLPAPRDAEFMDLLVRAENALDPQLHLSAHRLDPARLASPKPAAAVDELWQSVADGFRRGVEGVRPHGKAIAGSTGATWHATLDLGGHHVALSAQHDQTKPEHVSLIVLEGAGSPLSKEDWQKVTQLLSYRMQEMLDEPGRLPKGKVRLTHFDASARQPETNSGLFALLTAKELKGLPEVGKVHADELALAHSDVNRAAVHERDGAVLLGEDYDASGHDNLLADPDVLERHIEMYQHAIAHLERSMA